MNEQIQELVYKADDVEILPDEDFCDTDFLADMDPRRVKVFAELMIQQFRDIVKDVYLKSEPEHRACLLEVDAALDKTFGDV